MSDPTRSDPTSDPTPQAPILTADDASPTRELRKRVLLALEAGEVVALPTETVYGLAARADRPAALARLRELKGRDESLAFTWHVAERDALERFEALVPLARRLAERYWPGPLTLVLQGVPRGLEDAARDGWTGVRLPAHGATRGLLAAADFPVVMTSANPSGSTPLCTAEEVAALFGERLALVIDGGASRLGEASGVLRIGPGRFELLREGLLPIEDLRATAGLRLAFCCTGNTCRSPMAEGLARALLVRRLSPAPPDSAGSNPTVSSRDDRILERFGFEVRSMGVAAGAGAPASEHAVDVLAERGIDIGQHRSSPALAEEVARFDHVYCLTDTHAEILRSLLPPGRGRHIERLDPNGNVPDPIGGSLEDYRRCADVIRAALDARARDWA